MKYRPFHIFYLLCFLLLGLIPLMAILFNNGSMDFDIAVQRATERSGLEWTSNLLLVLRLCMIEPVILLIVFGSAVPTLAALIVLTFQKKEHTWKAFLNQLNPIKSLKPFEALKIYIQIFIIISIGLSLSFVIRNMTGAEYSFGNNMNGQEIFLALIIMALLDQGAILEELGWRGFATPFLQNKGMNPLKAAVIIGICWGLWHLPRDITTGVIERLGFVQYSLLFLPSFLLGTITVSIIASYFMNRLNGSVIPAIIIHGLCNDSFGLSGQASIIEALTPYHQITKALPFVVISLAIVAIGGTNLGLKKSEVLA